MQDEDHFYVCLYKVSANDEIRYGAHAVSSSNDFSSTADEHKKKLEEESKSDPQKKDGRSDKFRKFDEIFRSFSTSMTGFLDMLPLIAGVGHSISRDVSTKSIKLYASRHGDLLDETDDRDIYRVPYARYADFKRVSQTRSNARSLGNKIPIMMMLGVVSTFEHSFGSLIKLLLEVKPEILSSKNIELNLKEIGSFESIDEIKSYYIDHQVESVMRESFEKQVETFERYLGIKKPIKEEYSKWINLIEVFERRNLFAHNDGVVNKIYVSKVDAKISSPQDTVLKVDAKYFSDSIRNMFEFGIKMIVVAWRRQCGDELEEIDVVIGEYAYDLIVSRQYEVADQVLEFCSLHAIPKTEQRRRMNAVNHANCIRLLGKEKTARDMLDGMDWTATGDEFRICVSSIRGEIEEVSSLMRAIPAEKVDAADYENWPVFYKTRDDPRFSEAFKEKFGRPFAPAAENRLSFLELMALLREEAADNEEGQVRQRALATRNSYRSAVLPSEAPSLPSNTSSRAH